MKEKNIFPVRRPYPDVQGLRKPEILWQAYEACRRKILVESGTGVRGTVIHHQNLVCIAQRFEAFAEGMEFCNAFSELNDPDDQRARFEEQVRHAAAGDENAPPFDHDYIYALEHGMPPTGGIGIGIDRLVMLLTGQRTIREVVLFPALK